MKIYDLFTRFIVAPYFTLVLKLDWYFQERPKLSFLKKLFQIFIYPPAIIYLAFDRFITGKPASALNYAANWLEKWFHIQIKLVDDTKDGITYYITDNFNHPKGAIETAADMLHIDKKNMKLSKWGKRQWAIGINKVGMEQLEKYIQTFPNLWQRIFHLQ